MNFFHVNTYPRETVVTYQWTFLPNQRLGSEPSDPREWARELNISEFLFRLLWYRGLQDIQEMDIFLSPGLRHLPPLEDWPDVLAAARLMAEKLNAGKQMAVWGDYDVDGITATTLVLDFLSKRGFEVRPYLPNRFQEGYGLNCAGIEWLAKQGVELLLTVDCGIANTQEIERARELGMTVVVSDHHLPGRELPPAQAFVDPKLSDGPYEDLAGVGVAFVLIGALNRILPGQSLDIRQYLDLVALGTIADVVPLTRENRILVKNGLLLLNEAQRPGIFALKEVSGLPASAPMGSGEVAFSLAPRINAAGRIGQPDVALDLLLAPEIPVARSLAAQLDQFNSERKQIEQSIEKEATEQVKTQQDRLGLVLCGSNWHEGVIGIVASRLVDRYYRPTLLLTQDGSQLKGSGRSIPEFDLYQALAECSSCVLQFGGHRQAAGFRMKPEALEDFTQAFQQAVQAQLGQDLRTPGLSLEARIGLDMVNYQFVKELDMLQPFGPGNPKPLFCSRPLQVVKHRVFGKDHVSLELRDNASGITMQGKVWNSSAVIGPEVQTKNVEIAFSPRFNHYNGLVSIDLQIKDLVRSTPS
jgi:single-stranded-DNA-specific exonuclease